MYMYTCIHMSHVYIVCHVYIYTCVYLVRVDLNIILCQRQWWQCQRLEIFAWQCWGIWGVWTSWFFWFILSTVVLSTKSSTRLVFLVVSIWLALLLMRSQKLAERNAPMDPLQVVATFGRYPKRGQSRSLSMKYVFKTGPISTTHFSCQVKGAGSGCKKALAAAGPPVSAWSTPWYPITIWARMFARHASLSASSDMTPKILWRPTRCVPMRRGFPQGARRKNLAGWFAKKDFPGGLKKKTKIEKNKYTDNVQIHSLQYNIHVSKVHCGSAVRFGQVLPGYLITAHHLHACLL